MSAIVAVFLAPFNFFIMASLAVLNLSFSDYAYDNYYRSYFDLIVIISVDAAVSYCICVVLYFLILRWLHLCSHILWGLFFIAFYQIGYMIFTMSDIMIYVKNTVEHMLFLRGIYSYDESLGLEDVEIQKSLRDAIIMLMFFAGNTTVSAIPAAMVSLAVKIFSRKK
ncbi:hypothetical protein ROK90_15255 [Cronobacter dublinensis]|uniref:hypothetical protein n=1 Tax=Cronobacter dublinensis TaxID=413497 RepID=UPI0023DD254B|nr:hypothetical protein [Cronobacter dublinensis]MDT3667357.1 hypothetical protein [Cronobacter dublinensis]WEP45234.1 hypothetical protein NNQ27_21005 [Cronobacter dublinensis]